MSFTLPTLNSLRRLSLAVGACSLLSLANGCTALHPVRGVPASYLPDQYLGPSRDNKRPIDPSLLVRSAPDQHRVAAGDVLSIFIPKVLGSQTVSLENDIGINPPINLPQTPADPPTIGYPIQVRDDDTISLPQIPPLNVAGMTLNEVEQAIRAAYLDHRKILNPEDAMVMVSLFRPRVHRVLVVRQEVSAGISFNSGPGSVNIGETGKGTAREVVLRAYENDVMHALSKAEGGADGLPGLSAENAVYIIRRPRPFADVGAPIQPTVIDPFPANQLNPSQWPGQMIPGGVGQSAGDNLQTAGYETSGHSFVQPAALSVPAEPAKVATTGHSLSGPVVVTEPARSGVMPQWSAMLANFDPTIDNPSVIRVPIRLGPGEIPQICEQDITLCDGDIVFIESRATEVFYTGGLIGGGQYTLPRDYDLRVLEAMSIAEGKSGGGGGNMNRSMGGVSSLNHDVANSASRLAILRTLPNGRRITIEVNLNKAMRYQEENIIVQPGDMLILEYTLPEAVCAFTQRYLFEGALIGVATSMFTTGGGN